MTDYKLEIEAILDELSQFAPDSIAKSMEEKATTKLTHLIETEKKKARIDTLIHLKKDLAPLSRDDHYTFLTNRINRLQGEV